MWECWGCHCVIHTYIGIKLAEASKLFGKKFACGASVVKTATGTEEIDVQGDVSDDMVDFIFEKWGVSKSHASLLS